MDASGYGSRAYALSFGDTDDVLILPRSGGHLLLRGVPGSARHDASGCYPIFTCCRWSELARDIAALPGDLVALRLVTDPFCPLSEAQLGAMFPIVRWIGDHYIVELGNPSRYSPSRHHRRKLRKARPGVVIEIAERPAALLDDWIELYETLSRRRGIRGVRRFSPAIFAAQFQVPGSLMFTARRGDDLLGADWYYADGEFIFAHLSAYSEEGYACSVSYPMLAAAIEHFGSHAAVIDLGGTPSISTSTPEGLAAFKAGWASGRLPSYFCGSVDTDEYRSLSGGRVASDSDFFPYYRRGEY